jgi:hypothetical protein
MSSFITTIDGIVATLQGNTALNDYTKAEFNNKTITVKKIFKKRTDVNIADLPIILITRPSLEKSHLINSPRNGKNTVRLYVGFHQTDKRKALDNFIQLEEKIDDALLAVAPETLGAISINPNESANDEGMFHPIYFMAMNVEILHRR